MTFYEKRKPIRAEFDTDGEGKVDRMMYYEAPGRIAQVWENPVQSRAQTRSDLRRRGHTLMIAVFLRRFGGPVMLGLAALLWLVRLAVAQATLDQVHMILHMLDYVAVDYPECVQDGMVLDQAEYDEQLEFSQQVETMLGQLPAHPNKPGLLGQAAQLASRIHDKRPAPEIATLAEQLRWDIIRTYNVEVAPKRPPGLHMVAALYQAQCSTCHGPQGQGDGPAAPSLDPSPSNFHDRQRMDQRSVYGLYSIITLGVEGTGMSSFRMLSEDERWALAFYVSNLASSEADLQRGAELWQSGIGRSWFPDLASIVTQTAREVGAVHGDEAVRILAFLRHHPDTIASSNELPLARSARLIRESLTAYRQGQAQIAHDRAVSAYLDGFELAEASLDTVDRHLRMAIETEMIRYRGLLQSREAISAVEAAADRIQGLLSEAQQVIEGTRLPASAVFFGAFVILLREGLEAILVLAAIFALLIKGGRQDALPYVHAGWIAALALGGITWLVASYIVAISGSTREVTEGSHRW